MTPKEAAYLEIKRLVEKFGDQIENYKRADYNETLTRRDFIDPFFEALGWDINNKQGVWESYREVVHEDRIKIGAFSKAPDYSFRLQGGNRLFFVEAKKPIVSIKDDINPAYQIKLYGYNAGLPVSIVTDFEEFAVYDCRKKPQKGEKAGKARVEYFKYTEYLDKFDFLWDTFGREQVIKGGLVRYARTEKKGTATVDKDFLQSLDEWRALLANNIYKNNTLTQDELNYAVQQTIDRLIFLRFAEDRGIEPYGNLKASLKQANHYEDLFRLFNAADQRYNSGLFHFKKERDNAAPEDRITGTLKIDNKTIKAIINGLYDNDYLFNVIPVEILGSAYEQFLGKQISIVENKAIIEDKPEVRKAGGVYYTPQYIVDYIVQQTVGRLCEGKTPLQVSKLKIVDPACGSGSFLLGAYQYLLDWHLNYYKQHGENPKKKSKVLTPDGSLTTQEKKRILLNSIYGVDIDTNAVEVTKLSLLLKCMEGETPASIGTQMTILHERVLPSLENNIKSGNSLIDLDYYDEEIDNDTSKKVKPFNWEQNFPEIFKQGGFDTVIGNPPYVFGRDWKALGISDTTKSYFTSKYTSCSYQLDMFSIFMERAFYLSRELGSISFIVPNVWLNNAYSASTRKYLLENAKELEITTPGSKVFTGISVDTIVYRLIKGKGKVKNGLILNTLDRHNVFNVATTTFEKYISGTEPISTSVSTIDNEIIEKIRSAGDELWKLADITRGVHSYRIGGYGLSAFTDGVQTERDVLERPYHSSEFKNGFRPFIYGKDLKKFKYPSAHEYISYGNWLAEPRNAKFFEGNRIYSRKILGKTLVVTIEKKDSVADQQVYITKPKDKDVRIEYWAAILGSTLMGYFIKRYFNEINNEFPQIKVSQLKSLPIKAIGTENKIEEAQHDQIVKLVEQVFHLNEELQAINSSIVQEQLIQRIQYTDNKINHLVYQLYNLTEEEIKIIEGNN